MVLKLRGESVLLLEVREEIGALVRVKLLTNCLMAVLLILTLRRPLGLLLSRGDSENLKISSAFKKTWRLDLRKKIRRKRGSDRSERQS